MEQIWETLEFLQKSNSNMKQNVEGNFVSFCAEMNCIKPYVDFEKNWKSGKRGKIMFEGNV